MSFPNAFSNELAQWIRDKHIASIVFIEFRPRDAVLVKQAWDLIDPIKEQFEDGPLHAARLEMAKDIQCCTGFVVRNVEGELTVLTCAHVLGPAFNAAFPMTEGDVNTLFEPMILCDHEELRYQQQAMENVDLERNYMSAQVSEIDCSMDLMALRISAQEVQRHCNQPHPVIRLAKRFPESLTKVVMLSWPVDAHLCYTDTPWGVTYPYPILVGYADTDTRIHHFSGFSFEKVRIRVSDTYCIGYPYPYSCNVDAHRTEVEGIIAHPSRPFSSLSDINICDFAMRLSQVNITSEAGSSGAPMLSAMGNFCGVLHGGNSKFSFYVSFRDLKRTLTRWGLA